MIKVPVFWLCHCIHFSSICEQSFIIILACRHVCRICSGRIFWVLRLWCQLPLPFNVRSYHSVSVYNDIHDVWLCSECWKVAMTYFCKLQFDCQVTNFHKIFCSLQTMETLVRNIMFDVRNHILCQASCEISKSSDFVLVLLVVISYLLPCILFEEVLKNKFISSQAS